MPRGVDATTYIPATLALLGLLAFNLYLLGRPVIRLMVPRGSMEPAERRLLTMAAGMGLHMVLCTALGALGQFNLATVGAVFGVSLVANIAMALAARRAGAPCAGIKAHGAALLGACLRTTPKAAIVAFLSAPLLFAAIALLGVGGDSYAYHLPQARLIADGGRLAVNEHLQMPLAPHYFHMLHATALLIWDDRLANVIHAATAILSALGVYYLGRVWAGRGIALVACAIYIAFALSVHTGGSVVATAYVCYGTAVFTPFATHCLARAITNASGRLLCLACFLMGVAVGIKTQAWIGVPAFAILALVAGVRVRRASPIAWAMLLALSVGGFWYLRNFLISGDPFHPLGGPWFGFWGWDAADLEDLRQLIADHSGLAPMQFLLVGPALALPLLAWRHGSVARGLSLVSTAGLAAWAATSLYDRFMLSIAPVVALASAYAVAHMLRWAWRAWGAPHGLTPPRKPLRVSVAVFLCALWGGVSVWGAASINRQLCGNSVCPSTPDGKASRIVLQGFGHEDWLRIYQLDLVWATWDMGADLVGGRHGPSRYRDLVALGKDGAAIKAHLEHFGRNALLANNHPSTEYPLPASESFQEQFAPCGSHGHVSLYVLRDALEAEGRVPNWPPSVCRPRLPSKRGGASRPPSIPALSGR